VAPSDPSMMPEEIKEQPNEDGDDTQDISKVIDASGVFDKIAPSIGVAKQ